MAGETARTFGVAIHMGEVMYGNIGTKERLDFTVVGSAVNEANRIEGLCRPLGRHVLVSSTVHEAAAMANGALQSLGVHALRGISSRRSCSRSPMARSVDEPSQAQPALRGTATTDSGIDDRRAGRTSQRRWRWLLLAIAGVLVAAGAWWIQRASDRRCGGTGASVPSSPRGCAATDRGEAVAPGALVEKRAMPAMPCVGGLREWHAGSAPCARDGCCHRARQCEELQLNAEIRHRGVASRFFRRGDTAGSCVRHRRPRTASWPISGSAIRSASSRCSNI